ncbi:type II and III secretion system protein family protein [Rhizorhapis sp. SPR117]|uniref:type II and III secretion system protein family protein n=1 Tax=Rhizorhapis sp. SPR117 TaxID=2912611 RepID=UPI001F2D43DF|nr:type II and III secretion system protein family protein [Rhizorhapis sp. SPR117]
MVATLSVPVQLDAAPVKASAGQDAMVLSVGGSRVVNLTAAMSDVVIADPSVVDVHVRSERQLYIIAKAPGETNLFVTSKTGKILYSGTIRVGNNLSSIDQMLNLAMPEADIQISTMNGLVLLTGTIKAPEDAAEAERLVQAFVGAEMQVISRLRTATPLQVNLQVRISEVNRTLLRSVGTNILTSDPTGGFQFGISRATRDFATIGTDGTVTLNNVADGGTSLAFLGNLFGVDVVSALDLAETTGLATTLAQPNLTSLSGETASFLAGGEYPYSVSNGLQGNTIEFKQFGVQLAFTPTVLSDGRISMRVRPTVSQLDFSINSQVPALKSRSAETTVELGSGQSFMIAGLLSNETANNVNKTPGLGSIPILGSLFKSKQFQRNETELVIVVTPYLVKPVNAQDIHLPTDGFRNATDAQGLLLQQQSDGISGAKRPEPTVEPTTPAAPQVGSATTPPMVNERRKQTADARKVAPGFSF